MGRKNYIKTTSFIIVLGLVIFQIFENLGYNKLKVWDESRSAVNAIEMMQSGNYLVPTFNGTPDYWNSKPPLSIWAKVISIKIFGINEFAVRFPSALAGTILILLLILFSHYYLKNIYAGLIATLVLIGSYGFIGFHVVRTGEQDAILNLFVLMYSLIWYMIVVEKKHANNGYWFGLALCIIASVYTKSIAGLVPLAGLALFALINSSQLKNVFFNKRFFLAMAGSVVSVVIYYWWRESVNPGYMDAVLQSELGLFSSSTMKTIKHPETGYYIQYLYHKGLYHFLYLLPLGLVPYFRGTDKKTRTLTTFCWINILTILFLYSLSVTKNQWYISAIYPFIALVIGVGFVSLISHINQTNQFPTSVKLLLSSLFIGVIIYISAAGYRFVYDRNAIDNSDYNLERVGLFLKQYTNYDELNGAKILTNLTIDQTLFYVKKLNIEKLLNITIEKDFPEKGLSGKIILNSMEYSKELDQNYLYKTISTQDSIRLIRIINRISTAP